MSSLAIHTIADKIVVVAKDAEKYIMFEFTPHEARSIADGIAIAIDRVECGFSVNPDLAALLEDVRG